METETSPQPSGNISSCSNVDYAVATTVQVKKYRGGGTACCVPLCRNTTKNSKFSFHKFPKERKIRNSWIHWIGRKDLIPNDHHRVCSEHFPDGKKTYLSSIPTVTPKLLQLTPSKPRQTQRCRDRPPLVDLSNTTNTQNTQTTIDGNKDITREEYLQSEINRLKHELANSQTKFEHEIDELKQELRHSKFSIDRFKTCDADFEFYTGFQSYEKFIAFLNFLSPACTKLSYRGSNNGCIATEEQQKRGRKRSLSPEEELFLVLSKLRCGLLERDLALKGIISQCHKLVT